MARSILIFVFLLNTFALGQIELGIVGNSEPVVLTNGTLNSTDNATASAALPITLIDKGPLGHPLPQPPPATIVGSIPNGAILADSLTWTATLTSSSGPVEFVIDGVVCWSELSAPWEFGGISNGFDTRKFSDGNHTLSVRTGGMSHSVAVEIANALPAPTEVLNLKALGAKGDNATDDLVAIKSALARCKLEKTKLYVPSGRYKHSAAFDIDSVEVYGDGDTSEFISTNPMSSVIKLTGINPIVRNIKHTCNLIGIARTESGEQASIAPWLCAGFIVDRVTIDGAANIGLLCYGGKGTASSPARIIYCKVMNTKADGIHHNNGSQFVDVQYNQIRNVGDDSIAVVSKTTSPQQKGFRIQWNDVGYDSGWGRGISIVGGGGDGVGEQILIESNLINKTSHAGILLCSESTWSTQDVRNVIVRNNQLADVGAILNPSHGHPGILIGGRSGWTVSNILIENNTIVRPMFDGIRVDQFVLSPITLKANQINGVRQGFHIHNISIDAKPHVAVLP